MNNWICAGLCAVVIGMSVWTWNVAATTTELRDVVLLRLTVQARKGRCRIEGELLGELA